MQAAEFKGQSVLIVEDEPLVRRQLVAEVETLGADVTAVGSIEAGKRAIGGMDFDFVLLDMYLPDGLGMAWLKEGRFPKNTSIIMMTAHGGVTEAVEAMRFGALDFLTKPFEPLQVTLALTRSKQRQQASRLEEHRRQTALPADDQFYFGQALQSVQQQLQKIVNADQRMGQHLPPVLVLGETGTGKTTIARWLHHHGPRASGPLVEVNCSALPDALAESELFGHERGAFTDARAARMGLFEAAHGGSLFLDELPSLSTALQAKVLKALEDQKIRRLGGNREITVDVRIIAAALGDLKTAVAQGAFREDLYHRLDLYRISLPPLRERRQDIVPLALRLVEQISKRHRLPARPLSPEAHSRLESAPWPGNVRELAHELERALVFEDTPELQLSHLDGSSPTIAPHLPPTLPSSEWFNPQFQFPDQGFQLEEAINRLIHHALSQTSENVSAAARLLGVSRDYVRYRLSGGKSKNPPGE